MLISHKTHLFFPRHSRSLAGLCGRHRCLLDQPDSTRANLIRNDTTELPISHAMQKKTHTLTLMPRQSRIINAEEGFRLEVTIGCLWLKRPGNLDNHFLVAGTAIELNETYVVIQSDRRPNAMSLVPAQYRLLPLKVKYPDLRMPFTAGCKVILSALIAFVVPIFVF